MINNYFFQFQLPPDKDFKIRLKRNVGSVLIEKLQEKEQPSMRMGKILITPTEDMTKSKPRDLNRYMELIDKRAKKSLINATYTFPRKDDSGSSTPSSIKSMNGVIVYKLHLQNKSPTCPIPRTPTHINNYLSSGMTSRMLLRQKIFPRKTTRRHRRVVTETSVSHQKKKQSKASVMSMTNFERGNPLHNSMLKNRRLHNKSKLSSSSKMSNYSSNY